MMGYLIVDQNGVPNNILFGLLFLTFNFNISSAKCKDKSVMSYQTCSYCSYFVNGKLKFNSVILLPGLHSS